MKILIPTSITLDEEKLGLEPGDTVRHYNPTEPIAEEDTDAEVLIAWANTADQLADSARRMKNVGLIQRFLRGRMRCARQASPPMPPSVQVWVCTQKPLRNMRSR